jgi:hypothetical protein
MALLSKTKNHEFPNGKAWEFMEKVNKANVPPVT